MDYQEPQTETARCRQTNDVAALQETKIKEKPSYHGHKVFFAPSSEDVNAKRGLLTIVKKHYRMPPDQYTQTFNGVETLAVAFAHSGEQHIVVNIYVPGDALKRDDDWERTIGPLLSLGEGVLITGDYNARSPLWFDSDYNRNGSALDDAYTILDCCLLNTYGSTRIAERPGESDTIIDITLVSPGLVSETSWTVLPLLGSDHRPILIKLHKSEQLQKRRSPDKFTYDIKDDDAVSKVRASRLHPKLNQQENPELWTEDVQVREAWERKLQANKAYVEAKKQQELLAVI